MAGFQDTFVKRPQFTAKIPTAVLETFSANLPEGFQYIEDHEGVCRIDFGETINLNPSQVKLPDETKKLFPADSDLSMQDILTYAYNSQQELEILPNENKCYEINGKEIPADKMMIAPLCGLQFSDGHLFIKAPPFPPPFELHISGNNFSLPLSIQQIATCSLNELHFESVNNDALKISYIIKSQEAHEMLQLNLTLCKTSSAYNTLAAKEILNAFIAGKGQLGGIALSAHITKNVEPIPDTVIQFWHHIVDLESELDIKFDISQSLTTDDIPLIEGLYYSFVEKKPYRIDIEQKKLSGTGKFDIPNPEIHLNQEILFEYIENMEITLLNVPIKCCSLTAVFNGAISNISTPTDNDSGEFTITLNSSPKKQMYNSIRYYHTYEEAVATLEDPTHFKIFKGARKSSE